MFTKKQAYELLKKYNKQEFHLQHARTVSLVMRYFAFDLGYEDEADFWEIVGLLHDIDFEMYPEEHCQKAVEILSENGADNLLIHAVCCHGYGICSDVKPEHTMEKVLFATDELNIGLSPTSVRGILPISLPFRVINFDAMPQSSRCSWSQMLLILRTLESPAVTKVSAAVSTAEVELSPSVNVP